MIEFLEWLGRFFQQYNTQLWLTFYIFFYRFEKKKYFAIRAVLLSAIYLALPYFIGYKPPFLTIANWFTLSFIFYFVVCIVVFKCLFITNWKQTVFFACAAYTSQHLMETPTWLLHDFLMEAIGNNIAVIWFELLLRLTVLSVIYLVFAFRVKQNERIMLPSFALVLLSAVMVIIAFLMNMLSTNYHMTNTITIAYDMMCCIMFLFLQFTLTDMGRIKNTNDEIRRMLVMEHEQHKLSQENIEIINYKCHDLKHQISSLRLLAKGEGVDDRLKELEKSVMIYDSIYKTGNNSLDIVLTEKKLICEKYNIKFSCMIDGESMDFFKEEDIFSLFGNAIDNAIESVRGLDEEKRVISLKVFVAAKSLIINIENYCEASLEFENGLPVTTKKDKDYHGFGVKSMRYIVEQYGGEMKVSLNNKLFVTNIIIPLSNSRENDMAKNCMKQVS